MRLEAECQCRIHSGEGRDGWDDGDRALVDDVLNPEWGWHVLNIESGDESPQWSYTVGLRHTFGVPDLVMVGLLTSGMHYWINETAARIRDGLRLQDGDGLTGILDGYELLVRNVAPGWSKSLFGWGRWFSRGPEPPMQQLVWPDPEHRMPWDDGASVGCSVHQARLWLTPGEHPAGIWPDWASESEDLF